MYIFVCMYIYICILHMHIYMYILRILSTERHELYNLNLTNSVVHVPRTAKSHRFDVGEKSCFFGEYGLVKYTHTRTRACARAHAHHNF